MFSLLSLLSPISGTVVALIQNIAEHYIDTKHQNNIANIQSTQDLETSKNNVLIAQQQTLQSGMQKDATIAQSDSDSDKAFDDAVVQTSALWNSNSGWANFANCIVTTMRPVISYALMAEFAVTQYLIYTFVIELGDDNASIQVLAQMSEQIYSLFALILSYWFVRRGFEKTQMTFPNVSTMLQKKK